MKKRNESSEQPGKAAERLGRQADRLWSEYERAYTDCLRLWLDCGCGAGGHVFRPFHLSAAEIEELSAGPSELHRSFELMQEARKECLGFFNGLLGSSPAAAGIILNKLADEELSAQGKFAEAEERLGEVSAALAAEGGRMHPDSAEIFLSRDVSLKKLRMVQNLRRMAEMDMPLEVRGLP